ncbi:MAG: hypothetical protein JWN24_822 [Phycisphaerales bacterium]|nr:hypothetical protein [Phycisphaerales bacterium]
MNFRTTLILAVVLLGLGVFAFIATRDNANPSTTSSTDDSGKDDSKGRKLFDVKADALDKLIIRPSDGPAIELAKSAGQWKLSQPVNWPADSFEVDRVLGAVVDLHSRGSVDLDPKNSASIGLDKPRYHIEASGGGKTVKLDVGSRAALGSDLYVRADDAKQADLVAGGTLAERLSKGTAKLAESLRDKQLVTLSSVLVRQIEVDRRGGRLVMQKTGTDWSVIQPATVKADASEASSLLDPIVGLRATEFAEESAAQKSGAQLEQPRAVVWISTAAPATQPATAPAGPTTLPSSPSGVVAALQSQGTRGGTVVIIGQPVDIEGEKTWVKVLDPNRPPVVAQVAFSQVSFDKLHHASPLTLRDKAAVDIDPEKVRSFTLAIDHPATTQPATRPAELREFTIERRKETPAILGPAAPPHPATQAATTQPATTQPATQLAATQPATLPAVEPSKWFFSSGGEGNADEGQVVDLLTALHPLRAEKYIEANPTTQPAGTYTLTVHTTGSKPGESGEDFILRITDTGPTGPVIAGYKDLTFELARPFMDKLTGDFKTKKPEPPPIPQGGSPFGGEGSPFGGRPPRFGR